MFHVSIGKDIYRVNICWHCNKKYISISRYTDNKITVIDKQGNKEETTICEDCYDYYNENSSLAVNKEPTPPPKENTWQWFEHIEKEKENNRKKCRTIDNIKPLKTSKIPNLSLI